MKNTSNILFYIRRFRTNSDGKAPIYIRITIQGKRAEWKSKELVPDITKSNYTKVDITNFNVLPIMKSKATVLSSHPKASYHMTGKDASDTLIITNPKEFWSLSKVLVVNVK